MANLLNNPKLYQCGECGSMRFEKVVSMYIQRDGLDMTASDRELMMGIESSPRYFYKCIDCGKRLVRD